MLLISDYIFLRVKNVLYRSLLDTFSHGVISLIICLPLASSLFDIIFSFLLAFLLDFDHFVVARSFSLEKATSLPLRPYTHSITFALFLSFIFYLFSKSLKLSFISFFAISSHVIRDADTGITPILFPLKVYKIPRILYYTLEVLLLVLAFYLRIFVLINV